MGYKEKYEKLVRIKSENSDEISAICPFHQDAQASLSINKKTGLWYCHAGCGGGNYDSFVDKLGVAIPEDEVERFNKALLNDPKCLKQLREKRGLTEKAVTTYKLGLSDDKARVTIPIYENGKCVNIRQHAVFKKVQPKMISYRSGFGKIRLFPLEELLKNDKKPIIICEGELKALLLLQLGFRAVSPTGGAQYWNKEWNEYFRNKDVILLYDTDQAGRKGADKVIKHLYGVAASIKNVVLPLIAPDNDVTDYFVNTGASVAELEKLIKETSIYSKEVSNHDLKPVRVTLSNASSKEYIEKYLCMDITATGKDLAPYAIPAKVEINCSMGSKICTYCPVSQAAGKFSVDLNIKSKEILKLIGINENVQKSYILQIIGVPSKCKPEIKVLEWINLEEIKLLPKIDYTSNLNQEYVIRQGYYIGHGLKVNQDYKIYCLALPHPQTQYVTFLMDKVEPLSDSLATFELTDELISQLKIFQPKSDSIEDIAAKLQHIAQNLSENVTKIYDREDIQYAFDLVYHSPRHFKFDGETIIKGWVEGLIVGDTRTGKTETSRKLINHYKAGELVTAENTSFAGLVGGMQQNNKRWSITWGILPRNDKRAIVIDEVSGMPIEDLTKLSGVRSSGIAEITKIQTERTFSRTRILWISNARSNRAVNTYTTGVDIIRELIGRPEDIARFDFALVVAADEVDIKKVNAKVKPTSELIYTSELCNRLVLWAWSRNASNIVLTPEAEDACKELANKMGEIYSVDFPLVDPAEQRIKLARMAIALAMRLFSTEDGINVIVKKQHVQLVFELLKKWYNKKAFNYEGYSRIKKKEGSLRNEEAVIELLKTHGIELVENLLDTAVIKVQDIQDFTGLEEKSRCQSLISDLVRYRALKRKSIGYVKTPGFIGLLRKVYNAPELIEQKEVLDI